jgi:chromosome segregation ATPase
MSYEPRSRGIRSRRTSTKKASRERKDDQEAAYFYEAPVPVDRQQLSAMVMNSLEHLGNQRFPLPPFSEHFNRWIKDVDAVLMEFTTNLPEAADEEYKLTVAKLLAEGRGEFDKRIEAESKWASELSELQQQLSTSELELSKVEQEERKRKENVRRGHEKSKRQILNEIETIDRQRLKLLRKKPTVLERIFGRSKAELEDSASKLQSRKETLAGTEKGLQRELEGVKSDYEAKRRKLVERNRTLREKLTELKSSSLVDDALEMRMSICQSLRQVVAGSVERLNAKPKENTQESPSTSSS